MRVIWDFLISKEVHCSVTGIYSETANIPAITRDLQTETVRLEAILSKPMELEMSCLLVGSKSLPPLPPLL